MVVTWFEAYTIGRPKQPFLSDERGVSEGSRIAKPSSWPWATSPKGIVPSLYRLSVLSVDTMPVTTSQAEDSFSFGVPVGMAIRPANGAAPCRSVIGAGSVDGFMGFMVYLWLGLLRLPLADSIRSKLKMASSHVKHHYSNLQFRTSSGLR